MNRLYDMIVIGGGPAGLTAGLYAGRAKLDTLIIEKSVPGGQITVTNEIVNYPGIIETTGTKYGETLKQQALNFGVEFLLDEVIDMDFSNDIKVIRTKSGEYHALAVVIATGASPRKLGFPGEKEYEGRGVAYCATCDGEFFTGMDVFVIGAGFAAAEEAIFLTRFARKVTVIAREPEFTCAKSIAEKVLSHPKIEVKFNTEILEATGDVQLRQAKFINNVTKEITDFKAADGESFGIFIFVGYAPQSKLFENHIEIDKFGFIPTDEDMMTNIPGVFAAGDIRPKKLRQVVTAVSDGAEAAFNIEKYIVELREKLGIHKEETQIEKTSKVEEKTQEFLDSHLKEQLAEVVKRFDSPIELVVIKDTNEQSSEMYSIAKEISSVSDKLRLSSYNLGENLELENKIKLNKVPTIAILDKDGNYSGIKYATMPGGHELNSFILAMYNVAGPGQKISEDTLSKIQSIKKNIDIKIGISLSCTKCPDTVQAAQRVAIENDNIQVEIIDVFSFKDFKDKHQIMSVPAMVVNDEKVYFGSKSIEEVLESIL
ncbi:Thioredoxin reductase [Fusobacterium necrogenes]|uniref:Thioredoxin reductase n=1 Tax=Fusobacterium necrogenes TaxID=858 RepID=A0A377GVF0_9FUSO|nr:FAD-dependent oxidoreductase [Fusobacterium necrogenes]STO30955.1 Thioredoxin reductase [Fusobacterium necrogenes]